MSLYHTTSEEISPYSIQSGLTTKTLFKTTNRLPQQTAPMLTMSNETLFGRVHFTWQSTVSRLTNASSHHSTQAHISSCNWPLCCMNQKTCFKPCSLYTPQGSSHFSWPGTRSCRCASALCRGCTHLPHGRDSRNDVDVVVTMGMLRKQ